MIFNRITEWLAKMLESNDLGPSLRKALAVGFFLLIVINNFRFLNESNGYEYAILYGTLILSLCGLYTWHSIAKKKAVQPITRVENVENVENVEKVEVNK